MSRHVTIQFPDGSVFASDVPTLEVWDDIAKELVSQLKPAVITMAGPLGAGKTTFVQALAKKLGVKRQPSSPTFALMRTYELPKAIKGIKRLIHVDAYRFDDEREVLSLGLDEELADGKSLLVVEWPERIPRLMDQLHPIRVTIAV